MQIMEAKRVNGTRSKKVCQIFGHNTKYLSYYIWILTQTLKHRNINHGKKELFEQDEQYMKRINGLGKEKENKKILILIL